MNYTITFYKIISNLNHFYNLLHKCFYRNSNTICVNDLDKNLICDPHIKTYVENNLWNKEYFIFEINSTPWLKQGEEI